MKSLLRKSVIVLGVIWIITLFIAGFLAYFVTLDGPNGGITDGLGRKLTEAPLLMRIVFGQERFWTGFGWFFGDIVIFFGSIGILFGSQNRL
jgi:hypothetical protein